MPYFTFLFLKWFPIPSYGQIFKFSSCPPLYLFLKIARFFLSEQSLSVFKRLQGTNSRYCKLPQNFKGVFLPFIALRAPREKTYRPVKSRIFIRGDRLFLCAEFQNSLSVPYVLFFFPHISLIA